MARETKKTGEAQAEDQEAKRRRALEEEGLEPEQKPGPRQNEGISSTVQLYATQEEADEASPSKGATRTDVDRDAAHVHRGEPPKRES